MYSDNSFIIPPEKGQCCCLTMISPLYPIFNTTGVKSEAPIDKDQRK